jgi:uroporphyrinogen decarboxylase
MIAGQGSPDQAVTRQFAYREPEAVAKLLGLLADVSADYLIRQVAAGADVVQIFDSWAGVLDDESFRCCCVDPIARLVNRFRDACPDTPVIGFPRGAGAAYAGFREATGVDALGLDWTVPLPFARQLQASGAVQGNLDPLRLVAGGDALERGVAAILDTLGDGPLVFNLGHGITPEAPIAHVEAMLARVRAG